MRSERRSALSARSRVSRLQVSPHIYKPAFSHWPHHRPARERAQRDIRACTLSARLVRIQALPGPHARASRSLLRLSDRRRDRERHRARAAIRVRSHEEIQPRAQALSVNGFRSCLTLPTSSGSSIRRQSLSRTGECVPRRLVRSSPADVYCIRPPSNPHLRKSTPTRARRALVTVPCR
jgi:hypothetical protein